MGPGLNRPSSSSDAGASCAYDPLTILMPVRNGARTVGLALSDLVPQLHPEDELLVIDDGSSDASVDVVRTIARVEPRIRIIETDGLGLVQTLNLGLMEATHDWIARADADDRYPMARLSAQRTARRTNVVLITGDYRVTGGGRDLGRVPCAIGHPFVALSLINPQRVPHPGVLYQRTAVMAAGGYRETDFPAEDLALWLRLMQEGHFVGVPELVLSWTMSQTSVSHSNQARQRYLTERLLRESSLKLAAALATTERVRDELLAYEMANDRAKRTLLLANDLRCLSKGLGDLEAWIAPLTSTLSRPVETIGAASSLVTERLRRSLYRRTF